MTHNIQEDGLYDTKWKALAASGFTLNYQDRRPIGAGKIQNMKVRYACPVCSIHVWGKPELRLICENCNERMI